ncbi:MAG: hypothetical protein IJ730_07115 [Alphaproteobacteria bacterium]|nr:hypothetical protein [Alphaproteobacteria bacterium]
MSVFSIKNINLKSSLCSIFKIKSFSADILEEWLDILVGFSEKLNYRFTEGACTPKNKKYVKYNSFVNTVHKQLENPLLINSLELRYWVDKNDVLLPCGGEIVEAYISKKEYDDSCTFGAYNQILDDKLKWETAIKICKLLSPSYGFFYEFPFVHNQTFYHSGIVGGNYDDIVGKAYNNKHVDIIQRISSWRSSFCDLCSDGHLREIYPINFINENHLKYEVFQKISLKDWIEESNHRGKLEQVTDELWAWTIEEADLENVTIELAKSDICLCVNKENPHRYDYGVRPEDQIKIENNWHKSSEVES